MRANLLRAVCNSRASMNGKREMNLVMKRFYQKTVTKPAPYLTKQVIIDKIKNGKPGFQLAIVFVVFWHLYFTFNGVDYNEIINYTEVRAPYPVNPKFEKEHYLTKFN